MSPVQQSRSRDPRSLALAVGGLVVGVVLLLAVFVYAVPKLTEQGTIKVNPGTSGVNVGNARYKASLIAQEGPDGGPILMPDIAGGSRDIWVQHQGDDPLKGWSAFDARRPGSGRECSLTWDRSRRVFTDPCTGATVPPDGAGLPHYQVDVDRDEQVWVVIAPPATTTPSTIQVTGSGLPTTTTTAGTRP